MLAGNGVVDTPLLVRRCASFTQADQRRQHDRPSASSILYSALLPLPGTSTVRCSVTEISLLVIATRYELGAREATQGDSL